MTECGRFPCVRRMTLRATVRQHARLMVWRARRVVICLMARPAIRGQIHKIPVRVTLLTIRGDVRSGERKVGCRMVKESGCPRCGAVTLITIVRQQSGIMIGICARMIVRLVTRPAIGGCSVKLATDVTLLTIRGNVRSGQGEGSRRVIKRGRGPSVAGVTLIAIVWQLARRMIRRSRRLIVALVTRPAIRRCAIVRPADMALIAARADVRAD
jgi:hypothetical protein